MIFFMMVLPSWTIKLEKKLDKAIEDICLEEGINLLAVDDSKAIENGKQQISNSLLRLYNNYDLAGRKRDEEFKKEMELEKKKFKTKTRRSKNGGSIIRRKGRIIGGSSNG